MDPTKLRQAIQALSGLDLSLRKDWYSSAAEAYNATRPNYPSELVGKAVKAAHLAPSSRILEIGCGPGTATVAFAQLGFAMVCLEPNPHFCTLARSNAHSYPLVEVCNQSFEEWTLEPEAFDAVLAANSMHWIPAEIGYAKASRALKKDGSLILLWNKEPQPSSGIQAALADVYLRHAPSLGRYEDKATQEAILLGLGQMMIESDCFQHLFAATAEICLTYTTDQYIGLLSTYSPYLKLDDHTRSALLIGLKQCLLERGIGELSLSCLSACHVARKDC